MPEKWNMWYEQRFNILGNKNNAKAKKYGKIKNAIIECGMVQDNFFMNFGQIGLGIGCDQVDFQGARAAGRINTILRVPNRWYVPISPFKIKFYNLQLTTKTLLLGIKL